MITRAIAAVTSPLKRLKCYLSKTYLGLDRA
jgi:hypothetical protein